MSKGSALAELLLLLSLMKKNYSKVFPCQEKFPDLEKRIPINFLLLLAAI